MSLRARLLRAAANPRIIPGLARALRFVHSQYGEDQMFRLLLHPSSQGTFVDVGAHHPIDGSNTFNLYLRGWKGVTIDPNPTFEPLYRRLRPGQRHLVEGVSAIAATLTYFEFQDSRHNTLSADRARDLAALGVEAIAQRQIACRPLRSIVEECLPRRQIDLLAVDCEGLDQQVLESLDLAAHRPTTILIEDYDRFTSVRDGEGSSALHDFMVRNGYYPIAQLAFSALYVARDWRDLFRLSGAFSEDRVQGGILPRAAGAAATGS